MRDFRALQELMDRFTAWRIPGNSVCVYVDGKEVFSGQSGYADLEAKIPADPDKLVNLYSCSKITTVVAALQLYEKGYFLLDDPLYGFIPEYADVTVQEGEEIRKAKTPLTLRHLFTMTSGLHYNLKSPAVQKAREITGGKMDNLTVAKCLAADPLSFDPGSRWQYSLSHDVLSAVVEVVSGQKFRDYVQEHIFDPLGMDTACYHNETVRDRMAQQYVFENGEAQDMIACQAGSAGQGLGGTIQRKEKDNSHALGSEFDSGGAGITASVRDYGKFCAALANFGTSADGEKILSRGAVDLLRTNQLNPEQLQNFNWPQLKGYGYGLGVRTLINKASGSVGNLKEFGWGGAAGGVAVIDADANVAMFYAHHMLNNQESFCMPRLINTLYSCL